MGGVTREGTGLKKAAETTLEHALKADVEGSLLVSRMVSDGSNIFAT
jgi:hypothetical protein